MQQCPLESLGNLSGGVDRAFRNELMERFDLNPSGRVRSCSKGNRQKVAPVAAFMTRSSVLLLDEPTVGLDQAVSTEGFPAFIATIYGLAVALQVAWRLGATRAEEESGRLEAILAALEPRLRLLAGLAALSALGAVLIVLTGGTALWLGGRNRLAGLTPPGGTPRAPP